MSTGSPGAGNSRRGAAEPAVPQDLEAEAAVLGALLIDPAATAEVSALLSPADFYREKNGWVYEACLALHERGQCIDQLTVMHELHSHDRLEAVGGVAYVTELVVITPTSAHAADYAAIVAECAVKRRLMELATQLAERSYNGTESDEVIGWLLERAARLRRMRDPGPLATWADIRRQIGPIEWAWPGWLPRGLLTVLAADQEAGKSALALRIAQTFVTGEPWPDGTAYAGETGGVLWCEAESAQAVNLDRSARWQLAESAFYSALHDPLQDIRLDDSRHRAAIAAAARQPQIRLVVVDSLSGASRKEEKDSQFAHAAFWLAELARDANLPVLAIHHLRKRSMLDLSGPIRIERLRGHSSITQAARVVWALDVPDPARPLDRRLSVIKCNLRAKPEALGMGIDDHGIFFGAPPTEPRDESQTDRAANLLQALLAGAPLPVEDLEREARGAGISWRTMQRAKDRLHIVSRRHGERWYWGLSAENWFIEEQLS